VELTDGLTPDRYITLTARHWPLTSRI